MNPDQIAALPRQHEPRRIGPAAQRRFKRETSPVLHKLVPALSARSLPSLMNENFRDGDRWILTTKFGAS